MCIDVGGSHVPGDKREREKLWFLPTAVEWALISVTKHLQVHISRA